MKVGFRVECLYLSKSTKGTEGGRERRTETKGTMPWTSTLTLSSSAMFDYFKVLKKEADVYKTKKKTPIKERRGGTYNRSNVSLRSRIANISRSALKYVKNIT